MFKRFLILKLASGRGREPLIFRAGSVVDDLSELDLTRPFLTRSGCDSGVLTAKILSAVKIFHFGSFGEFQSQNLKPKDLPYRLARSRHK